MTCNLVVECVLKGMSRSSSLQMYTISQQKELNQNLLSKIKSRRGKTLPKFSRNKIVTEKPQSFFLLRYIHQPDNQNQKQCNMWYGDKVKSNNAKSVQK